MTINNAIFKSKDKIIDSLTGDIINMVSNCKGYMYANKVDLYHVAKILGTSGRRDIQKKKHIK
jgi:hypothetical protein